MAGCQQAARGPRGTADALSALQAKIGHGKDIDGWLEARGLTHAKRLWQALDIEPGWEDALEAVLRERLNALHLAARRRARLGCRGDTAAGTDRRLRGRGRRAPAAMRDDALFAKVRIATPGIARVLADGLHGVRCRPDLAAAIADRASLASGETFVTPEGHRVGAQSVLFFAPDSELHGVLARQRELTELAGMIATARAGDEAARSALDTVERDLQDQQAAWHRDSLALASQQRRCHDLELELVALRQAAEAASRRRAQIAQESDDLASQHAQGSEQLAAMGAEIADTQSRLHDEFAQRDAARNVRNETELGLARGREQLRAAERAAQEAGLHGAQLPGSSRRNRAPARRARGAGHAAAGIARAIDERARVDRLDAGGGSVAAAARRARRGRAGARRCAGAAGVADGAIARER